MGTEPKAKPFGFNRETLWKVGAAVAPGVGVLGVVITFGAAVVLIPLHRANIPVEAAVAAKSKTELLTVGGIWLVIFGLTAATILVGFLFAHKGSVEFPTTRDKFAGVVLVLGALVLTTWVFIDFPKREPQATRITPTSATLAGTVTPNGRETTWYFKYGPSTSYGKKTSTENAGSGTSHVPVSEALSGLTPETTYHYRLIASNASGTTRSADGIFTTTSAAPVAVAATTKNPRSPTAEPEDAGWSSLKSSTFWTNALFNWHFWAFVVAAIVAVRIAFFVGSYFSRPLTPPRKILFGTTPPATTPPATTPPTTGSFGWFVVALTVAIAVFLAAMAVAQTWRTPKLQSFALLRKGEDRGLRGFYVAETSNFVHVALVKTCRGWPEGVRIMVVPRSEVVALAIGENEKLCDAWASSGKHLADLIARRADRTVGLPLDAEPKADG